ncbi:MAG: ABC transporter ATP-binding protein, partial [Peptoniphilaceae bacterium]|nr:ABC transporter ATP-binding protein [Peptoniphilaceae bacterium]
PDSGEILINGKSVFNEKKTSLKNLGAMVEAPRFYENLSGYENLKLMANPIDNVGEKKYKKCLNSFI